MAVQTKTDIIEGIQGYCPRARCWSVWVHVVVAVTGPGPSGAWSRHQWRPTANGALAAGTRHCWPGGYYGATYVY